MRKRNVEKLTKKCIVYAWRTGIVQNNRILQNSMSMLNKEWKRMNEWNERQRWSSTM